MKCIKLLSPEEKREIFARQIRASGWLYIVAYKKLVGEFGMKGRTTIRHWMRTWGIWRGEQTRKGHHALGLDINMENLMLNWDSDAAATPELKQAWKEDPNCRFTAGCVKIITPPGHYSCPQHELWAEQNFLYEATVHCDEFHVKYTQGYCPDASVVVPECMTKTDDACHFTFLMDPECKGAPELPLYEGENPMCDWDTSTPEKLQSATLRRKQRITAGRIIFLWMAIKIHHHESAECLFNEIMDEWTKERGGDIKKYLADNNISGKISTKTIKYLDHPYHLSWNADIKEDDKEININIDYCPFAETWKWIYEDDLSILQHGYCSICYKNLINTAFPNSNAELTSCLLTGDKRCHIKITK